MTIKIIRPKYRYGIKFFSLDFGLVIWDLGFFSFSSSWRTWRFNLLRLRGKRLRKEVENENGHWSLVIGHWSLVIGHWSLGIGMWC